MLLLIKVFYEVPSLFYVSKLPEGNLLWDLGHYTFVCRQLIRFFVSVITSFKNSGAGVGSSCPLSSGIVGYSSVSVTPPLSEAYIKAKWFLWIPGYLVACLPTIDILILGRKLIRLLQG